MLCYAVLVLLLQDYDNALKLAAGPSQRDVVYQAMGTDAAAAGDWKAAGGVSRLPTLLGSARHPAPTLLLAWLLSATHWFGFVGMNARTACAGMCTSATPQLGAHGMQAHHILINALMLCVLPQRVQVRTTGASCPASRRLRSWRFCWWSQESLRPCRSSCKQSCRWGMAGRCAPVTLCAVAVFAASPAWLRRFPAFCVDSAKAST